MIIAQLAGVAKDHRLRIEKMHEQYYEHNGFTFHFGLLAALKVPGLSSVVWLT
jgi:hypothetical protein